MMQALKQFWRNEEGAAMIEYGLLAALVGAAMVVALNALTGNLQGLFARIGRVLGGAGGGATN
ncbi:MAG: Flp family type IVb pilin [Paludibacterium sp.]|uniref:Flp family type IVb pilin n=1 Tax=Paludibacterium sp. TaxID=1917523 RepID=UPI0025E41F13|nr:Flp family type IVb pilin [Paludibacterium sp.]MBV8046638.1 Flp family type IVb pilin [Paludibacterium sp.]MBV8648635.1 Flp family type IVb pilin [Paludibacterium sp.]